MSDADNHSSSSVRPILALIGAACLSFAALGVLWIGTPWRYQALLGVAFFLLAFALAKNAAVEQRRPILIALLSGAAPLGGLMTLFRDPSGSHLKPILVVCAWAAGILAGYYLAGRVRG